MMSSHMIEVKREYPKSVVECSFSCSYASFVQSHHCLDWLGYIYCLFVWILNARITFNSSVWLIRSPFNQDSRCSLLGAESELNSEKFRNSNDTLIIRSHLIFNLFHDLWRRLTESEKKDVVSSTQFRVDLITDQKAFEIHKNIYHEIRAVKRKQAKPRSNAQTNASPIEF